MRALLPALLAAGCATAPREAFVRPATEAHHRLPAAAGAPRAELVIPAEYVDQLEWDAAAFEDVPVVFPDRQVRAASAKAPQKRRLRARRVRREKPFRTTGVSVTVTRASGHPVGRPGHAVTRSGHPVDRAGHPLRRPGHPVTRARAPFGRPGHPVRRPEHPVTRPGHATARPGHPAERPGHPVRRPGQPVERPGHPVRAPFPAP